MHRPLNHKMSYTFRKLKKSHMPLRHSALPPPWKYASREVPIRGLEMTSFDFVKSEVDRRQYPGSTLYQRIISMKHASWMLTVGLILCFSSYGLAYESITVTNGGTISGKVKLDGQKPPPLAYNLIINNDTEFCGRISSGSGWRIVDEFQVAPDGGLGNVVVFLGRCL
jgi:hypothetical protein